MAEKEPNQFRSQGNLPKVPPEAIRAFKEQPHAFEALFRRLLAENPALAHELAVSSASLEPDHMKLKRAFAEGALFMYFVLDAGAEAAKLRELFNLPANGGAGGEDPPPSA